MIKLPKLESTLQSTVSDMCMQTYKDMIYLIGKQHNIGKQQPNGTGN